MLQLGSRIGSGSPVWPCRSLWDGVSQAVGGFDSLLASVSFWGALQTIFQDLFFSPCLILRGHLCNSCMRHGDSVRGLGIFFHNERKCYKERWFVGSLKQASEKMLWERRKKHVVPVLTAGCLRLDWASDSAPHLELHLQSVPRPSVVKLQHRFEWIEPMRASWRG